MLKLALFAALVLTAVVCAQKPCCGPKQFMAGSGATIGMVSDGIPQGFYTYSYGAFDFTSRMFGFFVNIDYPGRYSTHFRVIQKYVQGKQWIIDDARRTCQEELVSHFEPNICIPANASLGTDMTIGGRSGLMADSWLYEFRYPHDPLDATVISSVVHESCYPLFASVMGNFYGPGQTPTPIVITSGIVNMTIGISDPTWFDLPDFCNQEGNDVFSRRTRSVPELQAYHMPFFF